MRQEAIADYWMVSTTIPCLISISPEQKAKRDRAALILVKIFLTRIQWSKAANSEAKYIISLDRSRRFFRATCRHSGP
ncbi:hypothetical protein DDE20_16975 [Pararhodobacter oceanensis]|uniref:Uncharacterized protein n=1 Tax=Pararhodobacter oceanensis TaxID=2172121 RepID=A0A2T8HPX2_9RHOB|nr:hypothetical protein DDE20_16975 [Pararhodobacter oceanensis]